MKAKLNELISRYGKPLDVYECRDFIEVTFKQGTFRIRPNGMVTER